ncbi:SbcC-like subunit of palindrome specific endonuclease [Synechococcus phage S-CAM3]|uniref:Recombination-related endonuclease n=1 Tax=Synechococcus phage S-CAM3 TaxID=1883366 RepID=A0A1D8KKF8_9CAUD|nr:SbcC-like subunit of palindrome specific endonuclease [Synechococcus phage S-CAM3]AOV59135.1 recombination-related endonuclease [Synechococcus phage S-CAM3]
MIVFKKLRWKNFLSTGNVFTEIDLLASKTNLIIGANGAGKSTILDALTFSLFGKPFRKINKPMLVNSINQKDCMVEIEFSISKNDFKVVRGIKPGVFEIYQNGQMLDQASTTNDYQKQLETNILKMNYKSFTQIVVLGSSTFVPFMRLPISQRRDIIEDILDIQIFSVMNTVLKDKVKMSTDEMKDIDYQANLSEEKIRMQQQFIDQINQKNEESIVEKQTAISTLLAEEEKTVGIVNNLNVESKKHCEEVENNTFSQQKLKKLNTLRGKLQNKFSTYKKQHEFFTKNDTCPTCSQSITEDLKEKKTGNINAHVKELVLAVEELRCNIEDEEDKEMKFVKASKELNRVNSDIAIANSTITRIQMQVKDLIDQIELLRNDKSDSSEADEKLKYLQEEYLKLKKQISEIKEERDTLLAASQLLKDNGIKTRIIKRYLPVMNKLINQYLQNMDFYVNFALDENFEETIKSRFRDSFSYESFSEGEKARIDIALLLTWRAIAKLKNSVDTNILILDEIFDGSLDQNGTGELGWILRNFDDDTNVYVISHKENLDGKFDRTLMCEKVKNYSVVRETIQEAA